MRQHHETLTVKGLPVTFYCAGSAASHEDDHVRAAAQMLTNAILAPAHRLNDPYTRSRLMGEFRERLDLARAGCLVPRDDCRAVGDGTFPLYEIRWQEVVAKESLPPGRLGVRARKLLARLIHAEPEIPPYSMVALHAHEKRILPNGVETRDLQDEEIRFAAIKYHEGIDTMWGIAMLRS